MAKIIQTNRSYAGHRKKPAEFDLDLPLYQGLSTLMENEGMLCLSLAAEIFHCFKNEILKLDDPTTPFALCIVERPAGHRRLDRPGDTRGATLPIDVAPLERQVFTGPHSGCQGEGKQRVPFGFPRGREESPAFFDTEGLHLTPLQRWQIHSDTGIFGQNFPAHSLAECRLDYGIRILDRSGR